MIVPPRSRLPRAVLEMSSGASTYLFRPEQPDSDDGKFSADDGEDDSLEGVVGLGVVANGKRKRLSVSYVLSSRTHAPPGALARRPGADMYVGLVQMRAMQAA